MPSLTPAGIASFSQALSAPSSRVEKRAQFFRPDHLRLPVIKRRARRAAATDHQPRLVRELDQYKPILADAEGLDRRQDVHTRSALLLPKLLNFVERGSGILSPPVTIHRPRFKPREAAASAPQACSVAGTRLDFFRRAARQADRFFRQLITHSPQPRSAPG